LDGKKGIVLLKSLFNAVLRLRYIPKSWKTAKIIMVPKADKPPESPLSYRPISLLNIISKVFEKLLLKRLQSIAESKKLITDHQFGFWKQHATIDQVHRVVTVIDQALEEKEFCPSVFLDVSQAFDRVWHQGLLHKLKPMFTGTYCAIIQSYLENRDFAVHYGTATSNICRISAGVPQGSCIGPFLYLLYTADIPTPDSTTVAMFADDTAILATHQNYNIAVSILQTTVDKVLKWSNTWKIKLNENKSTRVDFTLRPHNYEPVTLENQIIPLADSARYLGVHLDSKRNWQIHLRKKRDQVKAQIRKLYWLIGYHSTLSLENKRRIYNVIIKPAWTYGIQLWGTAAMSNRLIIQRVQNKALRIIAKAPWYVTNAALHRDLRIDTIDVTIKCYAEKHTQRLHKHPNAEAIQLLDDSHVTRRLRRLKPLDLIL
jgi:hypothetical protein